MTKEGVMDELVHGSRVVMAGFLCTTAVLNWVDGGERMLSAIALGTAVLILSSVSKEAKGG